MGRPPCCCDVSGTMKRGPWTPEEDDKLSDYISKHGTGNWRTVPKHSGLNRCGKSCRLRWTNYLRPDIKRGKFTEEEERLIINLHSVLGNKWSKIATHLPGRTDNEIKNFWNTILRKKLLQMGIDPETHKQRTDMKYLLNLSQLLGSMPNNNNNLMRHASLQGLLQPDLTHQLAQIQLLQNLLQLMNGNSSVVNNMQSNLPLLGNHSLINNPIMEEDTNGLNSALTNNLSEQELYASPALFLDPAPSDRHQNISESWANLEGALDQQAFDINPSHELNQAENPFPATGSANFNQMERSNIDEIIMSQSSAFDAWEKLLLEDNTSDDSYWKELLESPISW